jgi:hypothetical protein
MGTPKIVVLVQIICGKGTHMLLEVVEEWAKSEKHEVKCTGYFLAK